MNFLRVSMSLLVIPIVASLLFFVLCIGLFLAVLVEIVTFGKESNLRAW